MAGFYSAALSSADAAMNLKYEKLMEALGPNAKSQLRERQRAWLLLRDKTCDLESLSYEGNSMRPMIVAGCKAKMAKERTKTLKSYPYLR